MTPGQILKPKKRSNFKYEIYRNIGRMLKILSSKELQCYNLCKNYVTIPSLECKLLKSPEITLGLKEGFKG